MASKKIVLITGCTPSGIGAALAQSFAAHNFDVYAAVRNPAKATTLAGPNITIVTLDVTSSDNISELVATISRKTGGKLDVLVNNAGLIFHLPLLDSSIAQSKQLFDVNVWGTLSVTQAFTPLLVENKGCIMNISSVGGMVWNSWQGIYNASKSAATTMSETLRCELSPYDVRVITAMVGYVRTKIYDNAKPPELPKQSLYHAARNHITRISKDGGASKLEPVEITAENLVQDVLNVKSGKVYRGAAAKTIMLASTYMPMRLLDKAMTAGRGLDSLNSSKS